MDTTVKVIKTQEHEDVAIIPADIRGANYTRQMGLFNPTEYGKTPITLIGSGSVGSFTALTLAKVGFCNIMVYDKDKVSEENIPNQFFRYKDIGKFKVDALKDLIGDFTGIEIKVKNDMFLDERIEGGIVLATTDSMTSRLYAFNSFYENKEMLKGMVDARMGGLVYRIYAILNGEEDCQRYQKYWYPDSGAAAEKCTEKAIVYNVANIASQICQAVCTIASGQKPPFEIIGEMKSCSLMKME